MASYKRFLQVGLALDPIHVGTGGARIGRTDLTIVRDPVTRIPKIPGSSLAGVYRTYVAMHYEESRQRAPASSPAATASPGRSKPYYPDCAGLGLPRSSGTGGHCGEAGCPVCTVFGFARGRDQAGGFAGLAAFSDAHVLLFPVPTRQGPHWVTCPMALRVVGIDLTGVDEDAVYLENGSNQPLNLGWLLLPVKPCSEISRLKEADGRLSQLGVPNYILNRIALLPDHLFVHIVNSNLEVRTSVSIDPETGAAEERALFSYEALPRTTVLVWEIIAKNPGHFKVSGQNVNVILDSGQPMDAPDKVHEVTKKAHPYLEHLGIGGMGTRGMGRVKVLNASAAQDQPQEVECKEEVQADGAASSAGTTPEESHEPTS